MIRDLTKGSPAKIILVFTLPLLIGNIFQQFYSLADTIFGGIIVSMLFNLFSNVMRAYALSIS